MNETASKTMNETTKRTMNEIATRAMNETAKKTLHENTHNLGMRTQIPDKWLVLNCQLGPGAFVPWAQGPERRKFNIFSWTGGTSMKATAQRFMDDTAK